MRPSWDNYFLEIAKVVSSRSTCLRKKVGAVIVDPYNKIKSTGYNGTPHGVESCIEKGFCYREANNIKSGTMYETCRSIHAEQNAIIQAGEDKSRGGTIYIYGHDFICVLCKRFIVQAGLKRAVLKKDDLSPIISFNTHDWIKDL
ncbi:MAG TPA: dCMP deaminase family protein [Spirochaetota bacterium]|nr:dCMP deaminase family protein [Spirochaetota bacterium]HOM38081.1 dCMP deaminase family protein [Spirochaetota bacterium]